MKRELLFIWFLMALLPCGINAQTTDSTIAFPNAYSWYVGVNGGIPLGVSTFSSFGADKTHYGWTTGAFVGYHFNPLFSLEFSAKIGQTTLAVRESDMSGNYWLGSDLVRYYAPVIDMTGWNYNNLTSQVNFQQYALQLNLNALNLFKSGNYCPWILELSPTVSGVITQAHFITIVENEEVMKCDTQWHLGVGGNMQVGYRVSNHLSIGVYGGLTHLMGNHYDKIPGHTYKANNLYEGGLKVSWLFNRKMKQKTEPIQIACSTSIEKEEAPQVAQKELVGEPIKEELEEKVGIASNNVEEKISISLPIIYFDFNHTDITETEIEKMQEILTHLENNSDMKITITGWCDTVGSSEVNDRYSLRRAESVKKWLLENNIEASRVITIGKGSDFNEVSPAIARRAETTPTKEDKQ